MNFSIFFFYLLCCHFSPAGVCVRCAPHSYRRLVIFKSLICFILTVVQNITQGSFHLLISKTKSFLKACSVVNACMSLRQRKFEDETKDRRNVNCSLALSACLTNGMLIFSPYVQFNGNCIDFRQNSLNGLVLKLSTWLKLLR